MDTMKRLIWILLLISFPAYAHGPYAFVDDYGKMWIANPTDHYHFCTVNGVYFDLYAGHPVHGPYVYGPFRPTNNWGCR